MPQDGKYPDGALIYFPCPVSLGISRISGMTAITRFLFGMDSVHCIPAILVNKRDHSPGFLGQTLPGHKHLYIVATLLLGLVHGDIGIIQQLIFFYGMFRIHGQADAA